MPTVWLDELHIYCWEGCEGLGSEKTQKTCNISIFETVVYGNMPLLIYTELRCY